jgi:hypothetical protein
VFRQKPSICAIMLLALLGPGGAGADPAGAGQMKIFDRVSEFASGTGFGPITLFGAAAVNFRTVGSKFSTGDAGPFLVLDGNGKDWMTFIGTYDAAWNTLTVTKFQDSSTGSPLSLSNAMHTVTNGWIASLASQAAANPIANQQIIFNDGGTYNGTANLTFDKSTGGLGIGTASAPARLTVEQAAGRAGILINNNGSAASPMKIYGAPRGDGHKYMTMFGGYGNPGFLTNGYVTINGASGDPVPTVIAGEDTYMLGINSDVGSAPAVVLQSTGGPIVRGYNGTTRKRFLSWTMRATGILREMWG